jgi:hypothetical protein
MGYESVYKGHNSTGLHGFPTKQEEQIVCISLEKKSSFVETHFVKSYRRNQ